MKNFIFYATFYNTLYYSNFNQLLEITYLMQQLKYHVEKWECNGCTEVII